jgi:VIT1/CCC1 family predicted Fe2+/Mn2+ transporter
MSRNDLIKTLAAETRAGGVHPGPAKEFDPNAIVGGKSGAFRAAIFGMNDGLVSNLSLIMGVAGAAADNNHFIVVAGLAGLLAGAFSMGAGEYVSMKVQRELFERLIHLEAHELASEPEEEHQELAKIYESRGISPELAAQITTEIHQDPELALETHAREELGLDPNDLGSPWAAALSSFVTFAIGAAIPLLPFLIGSGSAAVLTSIIVSAIALFAVGAVLTRFTGRPPLLSGARMLVIGAAAAGITFAIGSLFHVSTG